MFEEMSRHEIVFFLGLMYLFWSQVHIQRNIRKLEDENYELKRKISDLELEEKKSGYSKENLQRQITWLQGQRDIIITRISRIEN
jgi:hypothetical protein